MSRVLRAWGPAVLWAAILFSLSSQPTVPAPAVSGIDKVAHFVAYAVLGALLTRTRLPFAWMVFAGCLYGATDEVHQMFVPGRFPSVLDWVADALGTLFGVFVFTRWRARRRGRTVPAAGDADFART